jgi:hypothetical protein
MSGIIDLKYSWYERMARRSVATICILLMKSAYSKNIITWRIVKMIIGKKRVPIIGSGFLKRPM